MTTTPRLLWLPYLRRRRRQYAMSQQQRRLVIFDLNGTLAAVERGGARRVTARPGLRETLDELRRRQYTLAVWTSRMQHNALAVLTALGLTVDEFAFVWSRAECIATNRAPYTSRKPLARIPQGTWAEIIIVDDSPEKIDYAGCAEPTTTTRFIQAPPFTGQAVDRWLTDGLLPLLP